MWHLFWVLKDKENSLRVRELGVYVMCFPCINRLCGIKRFFGLFCFKGVATFPP